MSEYKSLRQMAGEDAEKRRAEFDAKQERERERLHAKALAYENYMYHSNTPEEKAINRAIWMNL